MDSREFSVGEIVDYMPGYPNPASMDVCVWFEKAKVQPITVNEAFLRAKDIAIELGSKLMAIIDIEAKDEFFVKPSDIMVINEKLGE